MEAYGIDEVAYFDIITTNVYDGSAADADSAPTFAVFENATDTPIVTGTMTKRTSLTGHYRGTFTCSLANGFEAGKRYHVVITAVMGGISTKKIRLDMLCLAAPLANALADIASNVIALPNTMGTRQIPDSYSADGAQPTTDQAILAILQILTEASVSGSTIVVKKPNGTTTAMVITCSPSVAAATSRTRTA